MLMVNGQPRKAVQQVDQNNEPYGVKHVENKPRASAMPYTYDIAEGNVDDHAQWQVLGYNGSVGLILEDVTELGVNVTPTPSSAIAMEVISSTAGDHGTTGTGAKTVMVHGLGSTWGIKSETVTMNGTTPVNLTNNYVRVNSVHNATVGSSGSAAGVISVQAQGGGTEYSRIASGSNKDLQCHWTVPDGYTAYITGWTGGLMTSKKDTTARLLLKATAYHGTLFSGVYIPQDAISGQSGTVFAELQLPIKCPSRTDIKVSAQMMAGTGTVEATASVQLWYEL